MSDQPGPSETALPDAEAEAAAEKEAQRDYDAMSSIPAFYIDVWYVTTWKGHIRITFGEQFDKSEYRTAIAMDLDDAERLGKRILRAVERRKQLDLERAQKVRPKPEV